MIAAAPTLQPELSFDEESHSYRWRGEVIRGVTSMLARCGLVDSAWFTEQAAIRGQAVHQAVHYCNEGRLDWDTITDEVAPYLAAWIDFCAMHQFKPWLNETPLASAEMRYAGTLDCVGSMNEEMVLIDLKTMLVPVKRTVPWWHIQRRLYMRLLDEEMGIASASTSLNVILSPKGYRIPTDTLTDEIADQMADAILLLNKLKGR